MVLVDRDGNIVLANAVAEAQFGYGRDELIGMSAKLLLPERFRGRYHKLRASLLRDPSARPMGAIQDLFGLRKDGSEMAIEIGLSLVDIPGTGPCVLSAITDISERRADEARRTFVDNATAALAASLDYEATLAAVTRRAVPRMADWCAVDLLDADRTVRNVAVSHADPAKTAWLRSKYPPSWPSRSRWRTC
jgi:PAS domain S-box-containing protein